MRDPRLEAEKTEMFLAKMAAKLAEAQAANYDSPFEEAAPRVQCKVCLDMGVIQYNVGVEHPLFGKFIPCPDPRCVVANERREQAWRKRLELARIPDDYQPLTFSTWERLTDLERAGKNLAYMALRLFIESERHYFKLQDAAAYVDMELDPQQYGRAKNSVMLTGPVGTGKTGLMVAAIHALVAQGESVLYVRVADFIESVKTTFDTDSDYSTNEVMTLVKTAPILALDEFNVEQMTAFRRDLMETVIRYRYGMGLPTLATTNLSQDEFRTLWDGKDARITDPLMAMAHWVYVGGAKLRKTAPTAREREVEKLRKTARTAREG